MNCQFNAFLNIWFDKKDILNQIYQDNKTFEIDVTIEW